MATTGRPGTFAVEDGDGIPEAVRICVHRIRRLIACGNPTVRRCEGSDDATGAGPAIPEASPGLGSVHALPFASGARTDNWRRMDSVEFAPTYSATERGRFIALGLAAGAPVVVAGKLWFFPWIATLPCRTVFGIDGNVLLWYGLFVGLPLLAALVAGFGYGRSGLRALREGQFPPAGVKVMRATRIVRGTAARRLGWLQLAAPIPFLILAVWGCWQAMPAARKSTTGTCAAANPAEARR
ncbi:hypothetical protein ACFJIW_08390 [Tahibacter sp. UC22_41]|uniref:hypothetical protein n=1 Tax=Tahibacter sp. UC22_41 TaxID=3350178 RepID=UPI0036DA898C